MKYCEILLSEFKTRNRYIIIVGCIIDTLGDKGACEMKPAYKDLDNPFNGPKYWTGKDCVEAGCTNPAGTKWGAYWCVKHNIERMDRISRQFDQMIQSPLKEQEK